MLLFLQSCGSKDVNSNSETGAGLSINFEKPANESLPKISEGTSTNIGPQAPLNENPIVANNNSEKPDINIFVLAPGIFRVVSYLPVISELELRNEKPKVIIGHGLGATLGALYAFGYKPDFIEWKFFKFSKEVEDLRVFSNEWLEKYEDILINDISSRRVEEGELTLVVPVKNKETNKVEFKTRGKLGELLKANIDLLQEGNKNYTEGFTSKLIDFDEFKQFGQSRFFLIDSISSGLSWKHGNGLLNGKYQKAISVLNKINKDKIQYIDLPLKKYQLDDANSLPDLIQYSREVAPMILKEKKEL